MVLIKHDVHNIVDFAILLQLSSHTYMQFVVVEGGYSDLWKLPKCFRDMT